VPANRFEAPCCRCGEIVEAGQGSVIGGKSADGEWTVTHNECSPVVDPRYWQGSILRRVRTLIEELERLAPDDLAYIRTMPEAVLLRGRLASVDRPKLEYDL
jgi:hypothetical protein